MTKLSPKSLMLLLLAAVVVVIQCRTPRWHRSEPFGITYGPARVHRLKDADARRVWNMTYVPTGNERSFVPSSYYRYMAGFSPNWASATSYVPRVYALDEHPLIAGLLGDVTLYVMFPPTSPGADVPSLMAAHSGRLYDFEWESSLLLYDVGVRFARKDMGDWARLMSFTRRWRVFRSSEVSCGLLGYDDSTSVIPALKFDSVRVIECASPVERKALVFLESNGLPLQDTFPVWIDVNSKGDSVFCPSTIVPPPME